MDVYNSSLKELKGFFVMVWGDAGLVGCGDVFACELIENWFRVAFLFSDTFGNSQYFTSTHCKRGFLYSDLYAKLMIFFSKYRNANDIYRPNSLSKNSDKYLYYKYGCMKWL